MAPVLLIAEPDPLQRQLIDMLLAQDRYDFVFVSSGREALSYLKESTPALAMLNLELPDLTGAEICEKMKRVTRLSDVPVVLVAESNDTVGIDPATRELYRAVGADLLLQKPLGDKNLRDRIKRLLETEVTSPRPSTDMRNTRAIEETLDELQGEAQRKRLERENERLAKRVQSLEAEIEDLGKQVSRRSEDAGSGVAERYEKKIEELQRRNALLRQELEKCKDGGNRGGFFGRRRD